MTSNNKSPADDPGEVDYIVIYKATQVDGSEHGRIASELIDDRENKSSFDFDPQKNGARTSLTSSSGYMMRFARDEEYRELNAFDMLTLPQLTSYPFPQETLESLPATIRAELERTGIVQIRCIYHDSEVYGAKLGWEESENIETPEWFSKLVNEGVSPTAALDYYMVEIAGEGEHEENHTRETWAKARNVTTEAVNKSIRDVKSKIDLPDTDE